MVTLFLLVVVVIDGHHLRLALSFLQLRHLQLRADRLHWMASHQEVILLREVVRVVSEGHSILYEDGVTRLLTTGQLLQPQGQDSSSALERDGLIERQLMWILQQIQRAEL